MLTLQPLLNVKMDSKVRHWKYLGLILLWRYLKGLSRCCQFRVILSQSWPKIQNLDILAGSALTLTTTPPQRRWPWTWPWTLGMLRPLWASCPPSPCMTSTFWPWNQPAKFGHFSLHWILVPSCLHADHYSSATVMTLAWPWTLGMLRPLWASCPPSPCMTSTFRPWNQPAKCGHFSLPLHWILVPICLHSDHYSSATVMTLDLAMDMEHIETPLSILPTKPLHHFFVLLLRAGGDPVVGNGCLARDVCFLFVL